MITRKLTHMHSPTHNTTCLVVKYPFQLFIPWELIDTHLKDLFMSLSLFWTPHSMWVASPISGPSFYNRIQNLLYTFRLVITWNDPASKISLHFFHSVNHRFHSLSDYHYLNSYLGCFLSTSSTPLIEPISCEITLPSPTLPHSGHNDDFCWRKYNTRQLTCCCHFKYTVVKY